MNSVQGTPEDFARYIREKEIKDWGWCDIGKHMAPVDSRTMIQLTAEHICQECRLNWTLKDIVAYAKGQEPRAEPEALESILAQLYPQQPPKVVNNKITTKKSNLR